MSLVMAGLLVSFSGIVVVCIAIFNVLPEGNQALEYAFMAIGWVFVIIGMIIRYKGLKLERQQRK
ncbi:hypothetical protein [Solibacillus sp. FSL H8-0538]|uniref:hypothetical protein n=1 Tax=Solibacillus sp. FSL H8-0538 TaxID=2921400 RepID=UPI0030FB8936